MTDLLKPIILSFQIDLALRLSEALLNKIVTFHEFAPHATASLFASAETVEALHDAGMRVPSANVVRLRQMMHEKQWPTELQLNCVVSRENITGVAGIARLALSLGLDALNVAEAAQDSLKELTDEEARRFADGVIEAVMALNGRGTKVTFQPPLRSKLEPLIRAISESRPVSAEPFRQPAAPRKDGPCLQPWHVAMVLNTGDVKLCAGPTAPIGRLADDDLFAIVNGKAARDLRASMLRGGPALPCDSCAFATADAPETFGQKLLAEHGRYDATVAPWQAFLPSGFTYDSEFGIKTQARLFLADLDPEEIGPAIEFATHYLPSPIADLDRTFDAVPLAPETSTLIDLGSGMGRVVFYAAQKPYREVIGVELSPALAKVADANLLAFRGPRLCHNIRLLCGDAVNFAFPDGDLVIYLFNPFRAQVMQQIVDRLGAHDGKVAIVYLAPEAAAVLDAHPGFVPFTDVVLEDRRNVARIWVSRNMQT